jgi:hypothetical protein
MGRPDAFVEYRAGKRVELLRVLADAGLRRAGGWPRPTAHRLRLHHVRTARTTIVIIVVSLQPAPPPLPRRCRDG